VRTINGEKGANISPEEWESRSPSFHLEEECLAKGRGVGNWVTITSLKSTSGGAGGGTPFQRPFSSEKGEKFKSSGRGEEEETNDLPCRTHKKKKRSELPLWKGAVQGGRVHALEGKMKEKGFVEKRQIGGERKSSRIAYNKEGDLLGGNDTTPSKRTFEVSAKKKTTSRMKRLHRKGRKLRHRSGGRAHR